MGSPGVRELATFSPRDVTSLSPVHSHARVVGTMFPASTDSRVWGSVSDGQMLLSLRSVILTVLTFHPTLPWVRPCVGASKIILLPLQQMPWHPTSIPATIASGRAMTDSCSHTMRSYSHLSECGCRRRWSGGGFGEGWGR